MLRGFWPVGEHLNEVTLPQPAAYLARLRRVRLIRRPVRRLRQVRNLVYFCLDTTERMFYNLVKEIYQLTFFRMIQIFELVI